MLVTLPSAAPPFRSNLWAALLAPLPLLFGSAAGAAAQPLAGGASGLSSLAAFGATTLVIVTGLGLLGGAWRRRPASTDLRAVPLERSDPGRSFMYLGTGLRGALLFGSTL